MRYVANDSVENLPEHTKHTTQDLRNPFANKPPNPHIFESLLDPHF